MKRKSLQAVALAVLVTLSLVSCGPGLKPKDIPTTEPVSTPPIIPTQFASREAQVQNVEIQTSIADPAQVNAVVHGILTEACAKLAESQVQYASNTFRITVYVLSRTDIGCVQAETPFKTIISLDTSGLSAGTYTVIANGVSTVFTLPASGTTPTNTSVPNASATAAPTNQGCTDAAAFVADVTIPDNSAVAANTAFTKTWRLKNMGTCTWDSSYLVSYISGTPMIQQPDYRIVPQGQTVAPGQTVDVSVAMTSPVENGSYQSFWGLRKENGALMPIQGGANGNSFYVKIKVTNGSGGAGNITAASIDIELEQGSGSACTADASYFVHATIAADGSTTATYEINSTAGQIAAGNFYDLDTGALSAVVYGTVVFVEAGTKTINLRFVGPYPYPDDITVNLRVNSGPWHSSKLSCQ